jgi:hypothetical protein
MKKTTIKSLLLGFFLLVVVATIAINLLPPGLFHSGPGPSSDNLCFEATQFTDLYETFDHTIDNEDRARLTTVILEYCGRSTEPAPEIKVYYNRSGQHWSGQSAAIDDGTGLIYHGNPSNQREWAPPYLCDEGCNGVIEPGEKMIITLAIRPHPNAQKVYSIAWGGGKACTVTFNKEEVYIRNDFRDGVRGCPSKHPIGGSEHAKNGTTLRPGDTISVVWDPEYIESPVHLYNYTIIDQSN